MKNHKIALFILILLVMSVSAYAATFDASMASTQATIGLNESAEFIMILEGNGSTAPVVEVYSREVEWNVPLQTISLTSGKASALKITVSPTRYVGPGVYGIKLIAKDKSTEEIVENTVLINVVPPGKTYSNYLPSVDIDVGMPKKIDPRDLIVAAVQAENQNLLNLSGLKLRVTSDISDFNTDVEFNLEPLEKKVIELDYQINPLQKPGSYRLLFEVLKGREVIESFDPIFVEVVPIMPQFREETKKTESFLRTEFEITYTSESNVESSQDLKFPIDFFENAFTTTEPSTDTVKEDMGRFRVSTLTLAPGESKTYKITTCYRTLFVLILLAIAGWIFYLLTRSPITIEKAIGSMKTKEGGLDEMRVTLEVVNRTGATMKDITVVDYVPKMTELSKEFIEGTLQPTQMLKHSMGGMVLKWKIDEMSPGEDRLISYDLRTKLGIIGDFKLPKAKVVFRDSKGKETVSKSNTMGIRAFD